MSKDYLACDHCGEDFIESDDEGGFYDGQGGPCPDCGMISIVSADEHGVYANTNWEVQDIGQPKCDGSCGNTAEGFCFWTCPRAKPFWEDLKNQGKDGIDV